MEHPRSRQQKEVETIFDSINSYRHQLMTSRAAYECRRGPESFAENLKRLGLKFSGNVEQVPEQEDW